MNRSMIITGLSVCAVILFLTCARAPAQWKKRPYASPTVTQAPAAAAVDLAILQKQSGSTSKPGELMYTLSVQVTNRSSKLLQFTNNRFFLIDSRGVRIPVNRARFPEAVAVAAGQAATCDRIFFNVPAESKIDWLVLIVGAREAGRVRF